MNEKKKAKKRINIVIAMVVLVGIAIFCYCTVEKTIIQNEQESLRSLAEVNAQSFATTLKAKSNLIYAALSGDMEDEVDIQKGLLKVGEKGNYIAQNELKRLNAWKIEKCKEAAKRPGEVIMGPIVEAEEGHYDLYMTKAVYMNQSIVGYVQFELNLDEMYEQEQALSNLQLSNEGYCVIQNADGETIMPSDGVRSEDIVVKRDEVSGCFITSSYETRKGTPEKKQKLIAYEQIPIEGEELRLCIIEDYDQLTQPIEQIALYFCVFGAMLMVLLSYFIYEITEQKKEEELLVKELKHEKELNKANEALEKQEALMEKYNHTKTTEVLSGAIAHEFNNLMTPIMLYTELMKDNEIVFGEMKEEIIELESSAKRCEELARQLLSYSRQGRAEKVLTVFNATFSIQESVNIIKKLIPANITLKTNICSADYYMEGQIGALNQILLNLVLNAVHAMKGMEQGVLSIQFGLSTDDEEKVRLIVEDTGCGIPKEIRQQVFQPFFTTKKEGEGTGIGLTVVRRLTQEHGGMIYAQSECGKGTKFVLEFPRSVGKKL